MQKLLEKFNIDALIRYGIAAILIAVPLYPKFPFLAVPGIYVSIRIEDFLILSVTILWFFKNIPNLVSLWKKPIVRAVVLFLVTGFIATLSGIIFLHTATGLIGLLQWARRVEYFMGFFIAITSVKSVKDIEFYLKCIGIVLILVFIYGVGQKYFSLPVITTQNSEYSKGIALRYVAGGHLASTFAGHYDLATYVILTSPFFVALFFATKETLQNMFGKINTKIVRGIILFIIATSFWLMVNAASRISAVSYVVAISTTLLLLRKYKYIPIIFIITVVFALGTSNLFDRYLNIFEVVKNKLTGLIPTAYAQSSDPMPAVAVLEDRSTSIRLNVEWPQAIRAFTKSPLLGTGYSSTTLAIDNDYLRSLGEVGILGSVALFFVYFRIVKDFLVKSWPKNLFGKKDLPAGEAGINFRTVYLAGIIGVIPGILLNAVFIDVFEASKFAIAFWFMIGFGIAILYHEKNTQTN
ncbi:hypothetical protein BH10PAT1_BH10PAT1_6400 [soil metagenome]